MDTPVLPSSTWKGPIRPNRSLRARLDYYPTHPAATRTLLAHVEFKGDIWEPACGKGAIVTELRKAGYTVIPSDLGDYGAGFPGVDFLRYPRSVARNIVTNPPYRNGLHERFVQRALLNIEKTGGIAALLLPLYFLAGTHRAKAFQHHPATEVYIIDHMSFAVEHLPETVHSGPVRVDVAWFIWRAGYRGPTSLSWLSIDDYA